MKTVSVIQNKGGVGKTLISLMVASALHAGGKRVVMLDADDDGSATAWAQAAQEHNRPLPFPVQPALGLLDPSVDFYVFDTPAGAPKKSNDVAALSDYIIIPVLPGGTEVDRFEHTLNLLRNAKLKAEARVGVILNMREQTRMSRATEALIEEKYPVIARMPRKTAYQSYYGKPIPFVGYHLMQGALKELEIL